MKHPFFVKKIAFKVYFIKKEMLLTSRHEDEGVVAEENGNDGGLLPMAETVEAELVLQHAVQLVPFYFAQ